jgi:hypothetical protein
MKMNAEAESLMLALLREILAGQAAILEALGRKQEPDAAIAALLHAIVAVFGGSLFTVKQVMAHAELPEAEALRAAIFGAVGSMNNPHKLGKLFGRIAGIEYDGLAVHKIGTTSHVMGWMVKGV